MMLRMATKQIVLSDVSATELDDSNHVTAIIRHPDVSFPVQIDMASDEAEKLTDTTLRLVEFEIHAPNAPVRTVRVETKTLDKLFSGVNWDDVVAGAQKVTETRSSTPSKRAAAAPKGEGGVKLDYTSPEHAGKLHRGRITEAEKDWVKANQDKASYNREQQTGKPIDFTEAQEQKRYGL